MKKLISIALLALCSLVFGIEEGEIPKSIYRVEVVDNENKAVSIGTGWVIKGKDETPYLISCAHVLREVGFKTNLEPGKGEHTKGEVVYINNIFDVGVVKITDKKPEAYNTFSKESPKIGDEVFAYGANKTSDPRKTKVGTIEREMEIFWFREEDKLIGAAGRHLRLTIDVERGNSGGPVYNNKTLEIVGMLVSMSTPWEQETKERGKAGMLTFEFITNLLKREGYINE